MATIEKLGNPLVEDSGSLFVPDTKDVIGEEVINAVRTILENGEKQYSTFIEEPFVNGEKTNSLKQERLS